MALRLLVVDESQFSRRQYAAALSAAGALVTATACFDQIDSLIPSELDIDLAVVNLANPARHPLVDDFVGFAAIEELNRRCPRSPTVVAYTSFASHAGLRLRARALGVHRVFSRSELEDDHDVAPLAATIFSLGLKPSVEIEFTPADDSERINLGIPTQGDLEALVRSAGRLLVDASSLGAQRSFQARRDFGTEHRVSAMLKSGGTSDQRWPSWAQIERAWQWLAKTSV